MKHFQKLPFLAKIFHQESNPKQRVLTEWLFFLKLQRAFGNFPVYFSRDVETLLVKYQIWSRISSFSFLIAAIRIFAVIYHFQGWGFSFLGRNYENTLEDWIVRCMSVVLPFFQIWDIFCSWLTLPLFVRLLNEWTEFEIAFAPIFPGYEYRSTLKKWRRLLFASTFFPTILLGCASWIFFFHRRNTAFEIGLVIFNTPLMVYTTLMEELKVVMMYQTLTEEFENLRMGVKREIEMANSSNGQFLAEQKLAEWESLLRKIRAQVKLTGRIQTPQQILVFCHVILFVTQTLFLFIKSWMEGVSPNSIWFFAMVCFIYVTRNTFKILMAERITNEEQRLADDLAEIDSQKLSLRSKFELQKLTDNILQRPSKIMLSGFMTLDKRIFMKVIGYIVAYLVVLVQFQVANNSGQSPVK